MHQTNICPEVEALSGSLKPYIGTDNEVIDDDEKAFLQAILDDDNQIKVQSKCLMMKINPCNLKPHQPT